MTGRGIYHLVAWVAACHIGTAAFAQTTTHPMVGDGSPCKILRPKTKKEILEFRSLQRECVPAFRSYRAPLLDDALRNWPVEPVAESDARFQVVADIVSRTLARDGLIATVARVVEFMTWRWVSKEEAGTLEHMQQFGFPVDLLRFFPNGEEESTEPFQVIVDVTRSLGSDPSIDAMLPDLQARAFRFQQTVPGFRLASDSGGLVPGMIRMQLSNGSYYQGPGDGGNLDVVRQMIEQFPETPFVVSVEEKHLDAFTGHIRSWGLSHPDLLTVMAEPWVISQWAQDNGRAGIVSANGATPARPVLLVPRYASRREEVSTFIPCENWLLDSIAATGVEVRQSPLLFQGGNLMMVEEASGHRVLLVGESEILRNVALGLSRDQAREAFRIEFGADACVELPAVSYHIDYEVSVRTIGAKTIAFVNDTTAATRHVLSAGLDAMERAGQVGSQAAGVARQALMKGSNDAAMNFIEQVLQERSSNYGRWPVSFANLFAKGSADSGIGNLQRLLLAMDMAAFSVEPPAWQASDAGGQAYARSLRRRQADRAELRKTLASQGWSVVGIPSTADGERSINYLNGVHLKSTYMMPITGGVLSELDMAATRSFAAELGREVRIVLIRTAESQRRDGALRCSVCMIPAL